MTSIEREAMEAALTELRLVVSDRRSLCAAIALLEAALDDAVDLQALALQIIESISANGAAMPVTTHEKSLHDIYEIAHGASDRHDGCPVRQDGAKKIREWKP